MPNRKDICTVVCDEYIYVIGGRTREGSACPSVFKVNPCNGDGTERDSMAEGRYSASAVTVGHEIFVFGGGNNRGVLATCEKYSPSKDKYVLLSYTMFNSSKYHSGY
ncbi:unnamed protein product [Rodentolepis nana]|uniref:DUF3421 domain-containing protein n=1 Tax=Rodentolepis nana TaxID=102285 RepID=A0A0R3TPF1_RODNA|nr:unnamed protein product [Rodentolepis nana]